MGAPFGVLLMMLPREPHGWFAALVSAAIAGGISVGWCYSFVRARWWVLIPANLAAFMLPTPLFIWMREAGLLQIGLGFAPQIRMIILAAMCVLFSASGFMMFVVHLRRSERIGARALAELDLASQVHASLVPPLTVFTPLAEIYGRSLASSSMGGDLIDAVVTPDRIDVLLGDVSGHGVEAGIVMAMLKGCIRTRLLRGADLGEAVADTNSVLTDLTESHMFATFVAVRISAAAPQGQRRVEFALAGHLPLFHFRSAQSRWDQHPNESLPLGVDGNERFLAGTTSAQPGDILAVFTDGLTEVQSPGGAELGLNGVESLLKRSLSPSLPAMYDAVMAGVSAHGPRLDDQSLVLIRIT